ncbi:MAG: translation initiation factor IF-3 [Bdellovibrio sp.]
MRVNREIRAQQVRVIDEAGQMLGVMTPQEGLRMAEERNLDLIEIVPNASPPTCKIMDYGKWKYENKKKAAATRKKQIIVQTKEIQLRPRTDQHDIDVKLRHARRFLLDGDKVKVNLRFSGREMAHQEVGFQNLKKVTESLQDVGMTEVPPKMEGRQLFCIVAPDPMKVKEYLKAHPKPVNVSSREEADAAHEEAPGEDDAE